MVMLTGLIPLGDLRELTDDDRAVLLTVLSQEIMSDPELQERLSRSIGNALSELKGTTPPTPSA